MQQGYVTPMLNGVGLITFKLNQNLVGEDWFIAATLAGHSKVSLIRNPEFEHNDL